jgi:hypothetical protein
MDAPADAYDDLWHGAAALGFFALGLPEAQGGAGYAITEEMVLFEELGRTLAPGPWLGSVLAAHALAAADDAAQGARERIVAGELRAALCIDAWGGPLSLRGGRVTGTRGTVLGAGLADAFLIVDDAGVLFVPKDAAVSVDAVPSLDATNRVGTGHHRDARARSGSDATAATARRALYCGSPALTLMAAPHRRVVGRIRRAPAIRWADRSSGRKHRCADMAWCRRARPAPSTPPCRCAMTRLTPTPAVAVAPRSPPPMRFCE